MKRVLALYRSSVGKKVVMAASGLVLVGFVFGHMAGTLKAFQGPAKFNAYSEFLREVGAPVFGHGELLWVARVVLLLALVAHVISATQLARLAQRARPVGYRRGVHLEHSYASRTMRWGGVIILLFVVYHLLHLTVGRVHPAFDPTDPFQNLVMGFQSWLPLTVYTVAVTLLGFHLYHGAWSAVQTLGLNRGPATRWRRGAAVLAIVIVVGFLIVPVAVRLGMVSSG